MKKLIVLLLLLLSLQMTDIAWIKMIILAVMIVLYIQEILVVFGGAASAIYSFAGKVLGNGMAIGIFGVILSPFAVIIKYGGTLFNINFEWSIAYAYAFVLFIIGATAWLIQSKIIRRKKIKSLFPLEKNPTTEEMIWIRNDLKKRENSINQALYHVKNNEERIALLNEQDSLNKIIDRLLISDSVASDDEVLIHKLNEMYQHELIYNIKVSVNPFG